MLQIPHRQNARVRDQDVDAAKAVHGSFHHGFAGGDGAGIGFDGEGVVAADFGDEGVGGGGVGGVVEGDFGAEGGEAEGGGAADALGCAGDEGDFGGEGHGCCVLIW